VTGMELRCHPTRPQHLPERNAAWRSQPQISDQALTAAPASFSRRLESGHAPDGWDQLPAKVRTQSQRIQNPLARAQPAPPEWRSACPTGDFDESDCLYTCMQAYEDKDTKVW